MALGWDLYMKKKNKKKNNQISPHIRACPPCPAGVSPVTRRSTSSLAATALRSAAIDSAIARASASFPVAASTLRWSWGVFFFFFFVCTMRTRPEIKQKKANNKYLIVVFGDAANELVLGERNVAFAP
jgi:hypothetical protein